jgi:hypothetical protein
MNHDVCQKRKPERQKKKQTKNNTLTTRQQTPKKQSETKIRTLSNVTFM